LGNLFFGAKGHRIESLLCDLLMLQTKAQGTNANECGFRFGTTTDFKFDSFYSTVLIDLQHENTWSNVNCHTDLHKQTLTADQ
jgi:hypothetical protein